MEEEREGKNRRVGKGREERDGRNRRKRIGNGR